MYGLGLRFWIFPVFVLIILISVIGIGMYQLKTGENPWGGGGNNIQSFKYLEKTNIDDSAISGSIE